MLLLKWFKWAKSLPSALLKTGFYVLLLVVLMMSLIPVEEGPVTLVNDKVMHCFAFLVMAFVMEEFAHPSERFNFFKPVLLLMYGGLIELLQGQTGYRDLSLADLLADGVGIALFYAGAFWWRGRIKRIK